MKIENQILKIIEAGHSDGNLYYLSPEPLDRKVYVEVNKVLEALGGKWNRSKKAHIFENSIEAAITNVINTGEVMNHKTELQFFETPAILGDQMCELLEYSGGNIGEPEAGRGALLKAIERNFYLDSGFLNGKVFWWEIDPTNAVHVQALGIGCKIGDDFLKARPDEVPPLDRIIMNPPFSMNGSGSQTDIDHVTHAMKFVQSGGIIVSVMSPAIKFRNNKKTSDFRVLLNKFKHEIIDVPDGAFKESGTMIKTVIVKVIV